MFRINLLGRSINISADLSPHMFISVFHSFQEVRHDHNYPPFSIFDNLCPLTIIISRDDIRAPLRLEISLQDIADAYSRLPRIRDLSGSICRARRSILTTLGRLRPWDISSLFSPSSFLAITKDSNHMSRLLAHERDSIDTMHVRRCAAHWRQPGVAATARTRTDAATLGVGSLARPRHRPQRRPRRRPRQENEGEVGESPIPHTPAPQRFAECARCFVGNHRNLQNLYPSKNCW